MQKRKLGKLRLGCMGMSMGHNLQIVDKLISFSKYKGSSPAQFALAWLLTQDR